MNVLNKMTHKELVIEAEKQLKRWRCYPICTEMVCYTSTGEIPDAIGWSSNGSILFECKASRLDFLRDKDKPFRKVNESGMGDFRFYLTNKDVIKSIEEMPEGWGCYEVIDGKIRYKFGTRWDNAMPNPFNANTRNEVNMLRSWIRRNKEPKVITTEDILTGSVE